MMARERTTSALWSSGTPLRLLPAGLTLLGALAFAPGAVAQTVWGDVNGDAKVSPLDAQLILGSVVGLTLPANAQPRFGDANCDLSVTAVDAQIALSASIDLPTPSVCVKAPVRTLVSGEVRDVVAFQPVAGAAVRLATAAPYGGGVAAADVSLTVTTDAQGRYAYYDNVPAGTYTLSVVGATFQQANATPFALSATTPARIDAALTPTSSTERYGALSGRITSAAGVPVPGASVQLSGGVQTNGVFKATTTSADGSYTFSGITLDDPSGAPITSFTLLAEKDGARGSVSAITLTANELRPNVSLALTPGTGSGTTFFAEGFESGIDSWGRAGMWNVRGTSTVRNAAYPTYVKLAPDDATGAALPMPFTGAGAAWLGSPASGNFLGTQAPGDPPLSGGTSTTDHSGVLISPAFTVPATAAAASLSFDTWFEIESVNPNDQGYDIMYVTVTDVNANTTDVVRRLNPFEDPAAPDRDAIPYTSGGFNRAPVWRPVTLALDAYKGRPIRVGFCFQTVDELYNGFRGWLVDNVRVSDQAVQSTGADVLPSRVPLRKGKPARVSRTRAARASAFVVDGETAPMECLPPSGPSVAVSPAQLTLQPGATSQLSATVTDANGVVVPGASVSWSSSATGIATVSSSGLVTGVSAGGPVTITATSGSVSGSASVRVTGAPTIAGVTPSPMVPGSTATITGTGFSAIASSNTVTVGGKQAVVTSATTTQLVITVPCAASGDVPIVVSTGGASSTPHVQALAVTRRSLLPGQSVVVTSSAGSLCNELPAAGGPARYLVTVFNGSTTLSSVSDFELRGSTPIASPVVVVPAAQAPAVAMETLADLEEGFERAHMMRVEANRRLGDELRMLAARDPDAFPRDVAPAIPLPEVGGSRELNFNSAGACNSTPVKINGKALYVGTRAVIWEDQSNTLLAAGNAALAGYYQRIGQIFDGDQYDVVKNNFGDPLLRDAVTDGDGRLHMIFTRQVNGSGAAAFVISCDQYPVSATNGASNFGEFFYGMVPTIAGTDAHSTSHPPGWFAFMTRTVVHEVKHIASHARRVQSGNNFEVSWLEEGTARHAEEIWARQYVHAVTWKGNSGYGTASTNGVYCDFHTENATCNTANSTRRPTYGMRRHFREIRLKLLQPWDYSPYGQATGQTGSVFYQTAWSLVRYAIDRYGTSDAAFHTALLNSSSTGTANLAGVAGVSMDQLIGGWGLALFADDYPGLASPSEDVRFPTWNLRNIYAGLNGDASWSGEFTAPFLLEPTQLSFGTFSTLRTGLRSGAHAYYELSGSATAPQVLELRGPAGEAAPTSLRIAIVRLQ